MVYLQLPTVKKRKPAIANTVIRTDYSSKKSNQNLISDSAKTDDESKFYSGG